MARWREISARAGRNDLPYLLFTNLGRLDQGDLVEAVARAWTAAEWPEQAAETTLWEMVFEDAGYQVDGQPVDRDTDLPEIVTLWRGAIPDRRRGMAWTQDRARAHWFAHRFDGIRGGLTGHVFVCQVPREFCLARFTDRGEAEVVLDVSGLDDEEFVDVDVDGEPAWLAPEAREETA